MIIIGGSIRISDWESSITQRAAISHLVENVISSLIIIDLHARNWQKNSTITISSIPSAYKGKILITKILYQL